MMKKIILTFLLIIIICTINSYAADNKLTYGKVVGLDIFETLDENTKEDFDRNISNLPNSMLDLQKRYGGTLYFTTELIPDYRDGAGENITFGDAVMGITYYGGLHNNDIYVRIDKNLALNSQYSHYWRTISHEYGHFAYNNTYNEWTSEMRNILTVEYNRVKNKDSKCFNESETFAHEYSKYVESETLVTKEMASLFKKVEQMIAIKDGKITGIYCIDEPKQDDIVTHDIDKMAELMKQISENFIKNYWNNRFLY